MNDVNSGQSESFWENWYKLCVCGTDTTKYPRDNFRTNCEVQRISNLQHHENP